jgi:hypothetical protein
MRFIWPQWSKSNPIDQTDPNPARPRIQFRFIWPQGSVFGPFDLKDPHPIHLTLRTRIRSVFDLKNPDPSNLNSRSRIFVLCVLFSWTKYLTHPPPPRLSPRYFRHSYTPPSTWINHSLYCWEWKRTGWGGVRVWTVLTSQSITYLLPPPPPPPNPSHPYSNSREGVRTHNQLADWIDPEPGLGVGEGGGGGSGTPVLIVSGLIFEIFASRWCGECRRTDVHTW